MVSLRRRLVANPFVALLFVMRLMSAVMLAACIAHLFTSWSTDSICGVFCHQNPDRCILLCGKHAALCVRCLGIYLGMLLPARLWTLSHRVYLVLGILVTVEALLKLLGVDMPGPVRFTLGIALSLCLGWMCLNSWHIISYSVEAAVIQGIQDDHSAHPSSD